MVAVGFDAPEEYFSADFEDDFVGQGLADVLLGAVELVSPSQSGVVLTFLVLGGAIGFAAPLLVFPIVLDDQALAFPTVFVYQVPGFSIVGFGLYFVFPVPTVVSVALSFDAPAAAVGNLAAAVVVFSVVVGVAAVSNTSVGVPIAFAILIVVFCMPRLVAVVSAIVAVRIPVVAFEDILLFVGVAAVVGATVAHA